LPAQPIFFFRCRSRDIDVGIFEPWDWVYFHALPSRARAETSHKLVQTQFFTDISVLRKCCFKNMTKIPFGEGQVQDPIPAFSGIGSKILAVLLREKWRKIGNRRTDGQRNDFNRAYFFKTCSKFCVCGYTIKKKKIVVHCSDISDVSCFAIKTKLV
jgi:hypothetical protein